MGLGFGSTRTAPGEQAHELKVLDAELEGLQAVRVRTRVRARARVRARLFSVRVRARLSVSQG